MTADWTATYGVQPLLAETLVDPAHFKDTAIGPPTGSTSVSPRAADAWIAITNAMGQAPSASSSTRWYPTPDKGSCKPRNSSGRADSKRA